MRRKAKVDDNQAEIVDALRLAGWSVQLLHTVGGGCPDLIAGKRGVNVLLEVKNLDGRGNKKTKDQEKWADNWNGQSAIVTDSEQAIAVCESMLKF